MDDETFARLLGEDGDDTAAAEPSAAEPTAIEAAVPDAEGAPDEDVAVEGDEPTEDGATEGIAAEGEDDAVEEAEADAEVVPISDPRHPDHAYFLRDQERQRQDALAAQAQIELRQLAQLKQINDTIEALPDADPATLPGTVRGLIAQMVAPVRQQLQASQTQTEQAAGVATGLHLAMVEHLPSEWVEFLVGRGKELVGFGSVEAASHVVNVGRQVAARENATITAQQAEIAVLKKALKAQQRNPDADRVPAVRAASSANRSPAQGESDFDRFFNEQVLGRG